VVFYWGRRCVRNRQLGNRIRWRCDRRFFRRDRPIGPGTFVPSAVAFVIQTLLGVFLSMGLTSFLLKAYDNVEAVQISDLWHPTQYWQYFDLYGSFIVVVWEDSFF
jgi:hypothetical protein